MFKFYRCLAETHVNTPAKYDIILYSITKVSGKRAQLFVQMLEKPKRTSSVCYRIKVAKEHHHTTCSL